MTEPAKTIMLVDDEENILITLGDFLAFHGYSVIRCHTGREALKSLDSVRPDLILLDIMMPGLDGGDVAQKISSNPRWQNIPIIYLTAAISKKEEHERKGITGGQPVIAKPVDLNDLIERIRYVVG
jgi:DNA-binding response OmpR family regulator